MAIWDTEEDKAVKSTFRGSLDETAKKLKKAADRGEGVLDANEEMAQEDDGDSGFEDVSSEDEKPKKKHKK